MSRLSLRPEAAVALDGLLDWDSLVAWLDLRGIGTGPVEDAELIGGGTQNRVVRFRRGRLALVLRCGPPNPRPESDETMRREARVLLALATAGVPTPRVVAVEATTDVLGQAFYVMEPVDGESIATGLDTLDANPAAKHRLGLAMVEALAELAVVDHRSVGLGGFGRPDGFIERQVGRWSSQLRAYSTFDSYPGPGLDLDPLEGWLTTNRPTRSPVGIMHGDFHIGNVLFGPTGDIAAVVDWELSTIGDPLVDLGQLLVTWPTPEQPTTFAGLVPPGRTDGFATTAELVERFAAASGWDLSDLDWYRALAAYRLGVLVEGTWARACAGLAPPDVGLLLHESAVRLWAAALEATAR